MKERVKELFGRSNALYELNRMHRREAAYEAFDQELQKLSVFDYGHRYQAFDQMKNALGVIAAEDAIKAEQDRFRLLGVSNELIPVEVRTASEEITGKKQALLKQNKRVRAQIGDMSGEWLREYNETYAGLSKLTVSMVDAELADILAPGVKTYGPSFMGITSPQEARIHPELSTPDSAVALAKTRVFVELHRRYGAIQNPDPLPAQPTRLSRYKETASRLVFRNRGRSKSA